MLSGTDYHPCIANPATRRVDVDFAAAERQHPRIAMRVAARILADILDAPSGCAERTWGAVRQLCRASIPVPPLEWAADLRAIRAAFAGPATAAPATASAPADQAPAMTAATSGSGSSGTVDGRLFDALFTDAW